MTSTTLLPDHITQVFDRTLACELSVRDQDGPPVTMPMTFLWRPDRWEFVLASGIVVRRKLDLLRRDGRVALSFTHFTGSGLADPPAVLVQGTATVAGQVFAAAGLEDFWRMLFRKKPSSRAALFDPEDRVGLRAKFYWRARVVVRPDRIWAIHGEPGHQKLERII
ncbi:pyridoxamine 5'-phosphate oxidase family protein [Nonomuraea typhae]|uniref:pyridoxamine 5'-phosphate oxidase family protein n=1 Tax=Nonomuraea typhae TaxID=2603600 RepID=UPI0012FB4A7B|nr:pyridoxamine 5'-phosphate oxidase [Nonomuraea typhae]